MKNILPVDDTYKHKMSQTKTSTAQRITEDMRPRKRTHKVTFNDLRKKITGR